MRKVLVEKAREMIIKKKPADLPVSLFAAGPDPDGTLCRWMSPLAGRLAAIVVKIETLNADTAELELVARTGNKIVSLPWSAKGGNNVIGDTIDVAAGDTLALRVKELKLKGPAEASIHGVYVAFMLQPKD